MQNVYGADPEKSITIFISALQHITRTSSVRLSWLAPKLLPQYTEFCANFWIFTFPNFFRGEGMAPNILDWTFKDVPISSHWESSAVIGRESLYILRLSVKKQLPPKFREVPAPKFWDLHCLSAPISDHMAKFLGSDPMSLDILSRSVRTSAVKPHQQWKASYAGGWPNRTQKCFNSHQWHVEHLQMF